MRNSQPLHIQFFDLLLMELSNWRWSWRGTIVTGMIAPLLSILALGSFANADTSPGRAMIPYILTGNLVFSLMFQTMGRMCSRFSFMRATHTLDFFATLPIQRWVFVSAVTASFLLLSLPSLLVTGVVGGLYLGVPIHFHPLTLLIIPLSAIPLAGIGALIGILVPNPDQSISFSNALTLLLMAIGPVIIPATRLHPLLVWTGWLSPASYAASALRQTLLGPLTGRLWLDVAMLGLASVLSFWLVGRKMSWREG